MEDTIQRPCNPRCLLTPAGNLRGPQLTTLAPSSPALQSFSLRCPGSICWATDRPHHPQCTPDTLKAACVVQSLPLGKPHTLDCSQSHLEDPH